MDQGNTEKAAHVMVNIVDGTAQPFQHSTLIRVHNGQDISPVTRTADMPNVYISVPFHDGPGDHYAVVVSADGYWDTGAFFTANPSVLAQVSVLMIRKSSMPEFRPWNEFTVAYPQLAAFLQLNSDEQTARSHYEQVAKDNPKALACLLNITDAMMSIDLNGRSSLSYFKAINWDESMAQDRFFGYVDAQMVPAMRAAAQTGGFAEEESCAAFHKGATCSWKQIAFDSANVQLTFHEGDKQIINGVECVKIEPDIDYYRSLVAHGFGEVFPNILTHQLTNPFFVYALRWATAREQGPIFDPGYLLV